MDAAKNIATESLAFERNYRFNNSCPFCGCQLAFCFSNILEAMVKSEGGKKTPDACLSCGKNVNDFPFQDLTENQKGLCCILLEVMICEINNLLVKHGNLQQAADLTVAFHLLPSFMISPNKRNIGYFISGFNQYCRSYKGRRGDWENFDYEDEFKRIFEFDWNIGR